MQALVAVQRIAVGALDAASAPEVLQSVLEKDPTAVGADILVMCGRIAEQNDLEDIARSFLDKVDKLEVATATSMVRKEYIRAALTARETSQGVENDDGSRSKKGAVGAGLADEFKMDSRRFAALKISRRIEGMRILERAIVSAKRMKGQLATQLLRLSRVLLLRRLRRRLGERRRRRGVVAVGASVGGDARRERGYLLLLLSAETLLQLEARAHLQTLLLELRVGGGHDVHRDVVC